MLTMFSTECDT